MANQLFMEERRRLIVEQLRKDGRVSVKKLSESLQVSAVTIRQDLRALETEGLLNRTHGGAVAPDVQRMEQSELSFDIRRTKNYAEKEAICRAAAQQVESGYAIGLDASTTVCSLIPFIRHLDALTVVTNNLLVVEMLLPYPRVQVLVPGGRLRRDSYSIVGDPTSFPDINLNVSFVSAWGITPDAGLTEVSEEEMAMKQALLNRSPRKVVLVDSSKWGKVAPYTYAKTQDVDQIITTNLVPDEMLNAIHTPQLDVIDPPNS